jgi:ribosomal 50S subunit-recycling heat shock protein
MRIDQYLKIARIVKKRPVSKELANQERILINGKTAKPSSDVKIGDEVDCVFGNRHLKIRVLAIADTIKKAQALTLYEVLHEERILLNPENRVNELNKD